MQTKKLQIDIIGDSQKFLKELDKVKAEAKALAGILGNSMDIKVDNKAALNALGDVKNKKERLEGDVESKMSMGTIDTSLAVNALSDVDSKKRALDTFIKQGMALGTLDVSLVQKELDGIKGELNGIDGKKLNIGASGSGGGDGGTNILGGSIKTAGIIGALATTMDKIGEANNMAIYLLQTGTSKEDTQRLTTEAIQQQQVTKISSEKYLQDKTIYAQATNRDITQVSKEEAINVSTMLGALEARGYDTKEVLNATQAIAKQKNMLPEEVMRQLVGQVNQKGFVDTKTDFFDNLAEYTQTLGKNLNLSQILNISRVASKEGMYGLDKAFDVNKELTPFLQTLMNDGTGGKLKSINEVAGVNFQADTLLAKKGVISSEEYQKRFTEKVLSKLDTQEKLDKFISVGGFTMGEDIRKSFVAILQATNISDSEQSQIFTENMKKSTEVIKNVQEQFDVLSTSTALVGVAGQGLKVSFDSLSETLKTGMFGKMLGVQDNRIETNTGSQPIINNYGNPNVGEQTMQEIQKSPISGRDWLRSKGKLK